MIEEFQRGDLLKYFSDIYDREEITPQFIHKRNDLPPTQGVFVVFLSYCKDQEMCYVLSARGKIKISTFFLQKTLDRQWAVWCKWDVKRGKLDGEQNARQTSD